MSRVKTEPNTATPPVHGVADLSTPSQALCSRSSQDTMPNELCDHQPPDSMDLLAAATTLDHAAHTLVVNSHDDHAAAHQDEADKTLHHAQDVDLKLHAAKDAATADRLRAHQAAVTQFQMDKHAFEAEMTRFQQELDEKLAHDAALHRVRQAAGTQLRLQQLDKQLQIGNDQLVALKLRNHKQAMARLLVEQEAAHANALLLEKDADVRLRAHQHAETQLQLELQAFEAQKLQLQLDSASVKDEAEHTLNVEAEMQGLQPEAQVTLQPEHEHRGRSRTRSPRSQPRRSRTRSHPRRNSGKPGAVALRQEWTSTNYRVRCTT